MRELLFLSAPTMVSLYRLNMVVSRQESGEIIVRDCGPRAEGLSDDDHPR